MPKDVISDVYGDGHITQIVLNNEARGKKDRKLTPMIS